MRIVSLDRSQLVVEFEGSGTILSWSAWTDHAGPVGLHGTVSLVESDRPEVRESAGIRP